ncbi:hypothetical protein PtB15_13B570 [Puccinia triticina]|nr:hypothetical protein PtB15_13B570 [Puccinia triticina]
MAVPVPSRRSRRLDQKNTQKTPVNSKSQHPPRIFSSQTHSTLSVASPDSPLCGFPLRSNLGHIGHQSTPQRPVSKTPSLGPQKRGSTTILDQADTLSLPQAKELMEQFVKLKAENLLQLGQMAENVCLERLAPNFCNQHQEYLNNLDGMIQACESRITKAITLGEVTITGPVDIGSVTNRKREFSSSDKQTAVRLSSKKACRGQDNDDPGQDASMETDNNDDYERDTSMNTDRRKGCEERSSQSSSKSASIANPSSSPSENSKYQDQHCSIETSREINSTGAASVYSKSDSTRCATPFITELLEGTSLVKESKNMELYALAVSNGDDNNDAPPENNGGNSTTAKAQPAAIKMRKKHHMIQKSDVASLDVPNEDNNNDAPPENNGGNSTTAKARPAARKMRNKLHMIRKSGVARKLDVKQSELDKYDLYSRPILMKDILLKPDEPSRKTLLASEETTHAEIDGNTRMEFGYYTKDILKRILAQLQSTHTKILESTTEDDDYVLLLESDHWRELQSVTTDKDLFGQLLLECPRLTQLLATHPYFNGDVLDMKVLTKSIDVNLGGTLRSGSWFALNQLMCQSTDGWPYHQMNFREYSRISHTRVLQILQYAVRSLHGLVMPSNPPEVEDPKDLDHQGSTAAINFLLARLSGLGAGLQSTDTPTNSNSDGVKSVITKIYELLLGIVLIYKGFQRKTNEIQFDSLNLPTLQKTNSKPKPNANDDSGGDNN